MDFDKISPRSMEYLAKIAESPESFRELTLQYIALREADNLTVPDFGQKYEWINATNGLSFKSNLQKKLCVLDFFTYCCINCMHILPQLHDLEQKHSVEDGLVVIGIHSAKFQNEKVLENVMQAVMRYDIQHPVVNDADAVLWNSMSIRCWPTFVIVSPEGRPLLYLVGEGHRDVLFNFVQLALDYYDKKGLISNHSLPIQMKASFPLQRTEGSSMDTNILKFPGKVSVNKEDDKLVAVSDTGNHRVLIFNNSGIISTIIGCGKPGLEDGNFNATQLNSPQGLAWCKRCLYIADTNNHVIRKADLDAGTLTTIVGTGKQGVDKEGGKEGTEQEIASPWDVVVAAAPGLDQESENNNENCLYIACTGTHQIWCYFLEDGSWLKKGSQKRGTCLRFAGSGNEENRNNSYPHKAAFAQPSHLSVGKTKDQQPTMFVADSESSSVRMVDLKTGAVKACVGAERDPMNLFAYGDVDGKSVDAKLQHPLAVEYNEKDGLVYVADSYNHKIKVIDPSKNTCTTLATKDAYLDNLSDKFQFNEPGGLAVCLGGTALYIADTNNHKIRVMDLQENKVEELKLIPNDEIDSPLPEFEPYCELVKATATNVIELEPISRDLSHSEVQCSLDIMLCDDLHYTDSAPNKWLLSSCSIQSRELIGFTKGNIDKTKQSIFTRLPTTSVADDIIVKIELVLFVCIGEMCMMKQNILHQVVRHDSKAGNDVINLTHKVHHKQGG